MSDYRSFNFKTHFGELIFVPNSQTIDDLEYYELNKLLDKFERFIQQGLSRPRGIRDFIIQSNPSYANSWVKDFYLKDNSPPVLMGQKQYEAVESMYKERMENVSKMSEPKKLEAPVVEVKPLDKVGLESVKNLFAAKAKEERAHLARKRADDAFDKANRNRLEAEKLAKEIFGSGETKKVVKLNEKEVGILNYSVASNAFNYSVEKLEKVGR